MQDVKINKEIRDYKEKIVLGLFDLRQTICMLIGSAIAVVFYFIIPGPLSTPKLLLCIIPALPAIIAGFFTYNKMPGEQLILTWIDFYIRVPRRYPSVSENKYYTKIIKPYLENLEKTGENNDVKNTAESENTRPTE